MSIRRSWIKEASDMTSSNLLSSLTRGLEMIGSLEVKFWRRELMLRGWKETHCLSQGASGSIYLISAVNSSFFFSASTLQLKKILLLF